MSYTTVNDKIYNSWRKMHIRCYDSSYHSYHRYGGRGIYVCDRWHLYSNFKIDMEKSWFTGATVDRIDNSREYSPENCSWKTAAENKKPYKYDHAEILRLYESGLRQKDIGLMLRIGQDRISKLLKTARQLRKESREILNVT